MLGYIKAAIKLKSIRPINPKTQNDNGKEALPSMNFLKKDFFVPILFWFKRFIIF